MKRSWILTILIIFLLVFFYGCSKLANMGQIEDTNGDDTSIVTITDREICGGHSYASYMSSKSTVNGQTKLSIKKMSGVLEIERINADNKSISIQMSSTLNSGNFRIVVVHNNQIIKDIAVGESNTAVIDNANGTYQLKIVGESANFSLEYSIDFL